MAGALTILRHRSDAAMLALSILAGILFFPMLEHVIDSWLFVPTPTRASGECKDGSCTWDLRTMWH
jgi:hypothetical protein